MNESNFKTVREVARAGICPERMLRSMVHKGTCPGIWHGSRFYVNVSMLQEQLTKMSKPANNPLKR